MKFIESIQNKISSSTLFFIIIPLLFFVFPFKSFASVSLSLVSKKDTSVIVSGTFGPPAGIDSDYKNLSIRYSEDPEIKTFKEQIITKNGVWGDSVTDTYEGSTYIKGEFKVEIKGLDNKKVYYFKGYYGEGSSSNKIDATMYFNPAPESDCEVLSVISTPAGKIGGNGLLFEHDDNRGQISFDIKTKNCKGHTLDFELRDYRSACWFIGVFTSPGGNCATGMTGEGTYGSALVMKGDSVKIVMTPGENICVAIEFLNRNCNIYVVIGKSGALLYPTSLLTQIAPDILISYNCADVTGGLGITYGCDEPWKFIGAYFDGQKPPNQVDCAKPEFKDDPLCKEKVYELLAPLPGLTEVGKDVTFEKYFKYLIRFVMGMSAVLAVVMIVIGGIQYMGYQSVFEKNEGKDRIEGALAGMVLLLASYLILNTINPQMVNINLGFQKVGIVDEPYTPTSGGGEKGTSNITSNITTYDAFLKTAAAANGLQCTTLKAFMYTESAGNPDAVSSSGAIGLIQLMPATAAQYGVTNPADLKDPQKNINAAGKFLGYLKQKACNNAASNAVCNVQDEKYIYAAYNGGPGSNKPSTNCSGQTFWQCTKNTGYQQTRDYVNKVANNKKKLTDNNWGCGLPPKPPKPLPGEAVPSPDN